MRGIAEIINLRHAAPAPARGARDQKGDAGVAFPPTLVRILQAPDPGDQNGIGGIGDIPDLMRFAAQAAQHIDRVAIAPGQRLAVADAHPLRAPSLLFSFPAWDLSPIFCPSVICSLPPPNALPSRPS